MIEKEPSLADLNLKLGRVANGSDLDAIPRALGRAARSDGGTIPLFGCDLWNAYEAGFLLPGGKPVVFHLRASYPAHSPAIIESKSFKLFLNALCGVVFPNREAYASHLGHALSACVGAAVDLQFFGPDQSPVGAPLAGRRLDDMEPGAVPHGYAPDRLRALPGHGDWCYHSHLLGSLCPVTGQPDWGAVLFRGRGSNHPDPGSLLAYLLGFRGHRGFHEDCCEMIFSDLYRCLTPDFLEICCFYTRRGGLDINPMRSSQAVSCQDPNRVWRQ